MKNSIIDISIGLLFGLLVILLPPLLNGGEFALVGGKFIINILNVGNNILGLLVLGLVYFILVSIIPFFLYRFTSFYRNRHVKGVNANVLAYSFFVLGAFIVYFVLFVVFLYYFSKNFGF